MSKSILFITSEKNSFLFDEFRDRNGDNISFKLINGVFEIQQYGKDKINMLETYDYIIYDRDAFKDDDYVFVAGINEVSKYIEKTIILLWVGLDPNSSIFDKVLDTGINNIMLATEYREQKIEINECFSKTGMKRYKTNKDNREKAEIYDFKEGQWTIVSLNADRRMKNSINMITFANFLSKVGGLVNFVSFKAEDMLIIKKMYEENGHRIINLNDTDFKANNINWTLGNISDVDSNFYIIDMSNVPVKKLIDDYYINYIKEADRILLWAELNAFQEKNAYNLFNKIKEIDSDILLNKERGFFMFNIDEPKENFARNSSLFDVFSYKEVRPIKDIFDIRVNRDIYFNLVETQINNIKQREDLFYEKS
ncbi:MAG: hypothetical protein IJ593_05735 [Lachnospiraceae bacterium]|nr:hypothetical protein [Lachnospiraceae bacterium]